MALMEASLLILVFTFHCNAAITSTQPPRVGSPAPPAGPPAPPQPTSVTPTEIPPVPPSLPVTEIRSCPKDVLRVDCPVNPCVLLHCPLKGAECVVDSCGKCRPRWIKDGKEITMECLESLKLCADGSVPQKCEVNPCDTARCPAVAGAVCVPDFCGGCRDRWIHDGMEVTEKCKATAFESAAPGDCRSRYGCLLYPRAECRNTMRDSHQWVLPDGSDVTYLCDGYGLAELVFQNAYGGPCFMAKCQYPFQDVECKLCHDWPQFRCINGRVWIRRGAPVTEICEGRY